MKSLTHSSLSHRQKAVALTIACLASAAFAAAQSSTSSSSPNPSSSSSAGSSYNSGSSTYKSGTGSSDINASSTTTSTAGAPTGRSTSSDKLSWGDKHFVTKAADGGADEIALAQLATEKASSSEVKSFAQKLVDDHKMVASELEGIASQKNVKLDKDNDHDRTYKRLSKKTGSDFDQEFVEHMVDEHEKDIKMFEKAANDAKDSDIRAFAAKTVDHLREHLKMAEDLRQSLMPTGRTSSTSHATRSTTGSYDTSSSSTSPSSSSSSTPSSTSSSDKSSSSDTSSSSTSKPDSSK